MSSQHLQSVIKLRKPQHDRLHIGSRWIERNGLRFDQAHPSISSVVTRIPEPGAASADGALAAARKALDECPWR